ncbi:MAG: hypothetical protein ACOY90_16640 [Candidatus Zhuqueibacterota bacterium]
MGLICAILASVYIVAVFVFIWVSIRLAGFSQQKISHIAFMALNILMVSWLAGMGLVFVPLELKPFILLIGMALIVLIFILLSDEQVLKTLIAGFVFIFCQLFLLMILLREISNRDLFRPLRIFLFEKFY